jgi:hypothetical protein
MRLTVNGVQVRVVDRIEIVLDVPEGGDTILNGLSIAIKGGPLTIEYGDSMKHAALWIGSDGIRVGDVVFFHDKQLSFIGPPDGTVPIVGGVTDITDEFTRTIHWPDGAVSEMRTIEPPKPRAPLANSIPNGTALAAQEGGPDKYAEMQRYPGSPETVAKWADRMDAIAHTGRPETFPRMPGGPEKARIVTLDSPESPH